MTQTLLKPSRETWPLQRVLPWAALAVCLALLAASLLFHDTLLHGQSLPKTEEAPAPGGPASVTTVHLPEGKWKKANIRTEAVQVVTLPAEVGVPGRIDANVDRRLEIRPRASGVIREVRVTLGRKVKAFKKAVALLFVGLVLFSAIGVSFV